MHRPKPVVILEHPTRKTEIYVLNVGEIITISTNGEHFNYVFGPCFIFVEEDQDGRRSVTKYSINESSSWFYINLMMQLGNIFLQQNPDFNLIDFTKEMRQKQETEYKEFTPIKI